MLFTRSNPFETPSSVSTLTPSNGPREVPTQRPRAPSTAARAPPVAARISAYNELVTSHLGECQLPFQVPESRIPTQDAYSERIKVSRSRRRARAGESSIKPRLRKISSDSESVVLQPLESMRSDHANSQSRNNICPGCEQTSIDPIALDDPMMLVPQAHTRHRRIPEFRNECRRQSGGD